MKEVRRRNYKQDSCYPRVARAVKEILVESGVITPVDVLIKMDLLSEEGLSEWRLGRVPYLEKVVRCNLSKANRILRILQMYASELKLKPSQTIYMKRGTGQRAALQFSKTGDRNIETAYSTHYLQLSHPSLKRSTSWLWCK